MTNNYLSYAFTTAEDETQKIALYLVENLKKKPITFSYVPLEAILDNLVFLKSIVTFRVVCKEVCPSKKKKRIISYSFRYKSDGRNIKFLSFVRKECSCTKADSVPILLLDNFLTA